MISRWLHKRFASRENIFLATVIRVVILFFCLAFVFKVGVGSRYLKSSISSTGGELIKIDILSASYIYNEQTFIFRLLLSLCFYFTFILKTFILLLFSCSCRHL